MPLARRLKQIENGQLDLLVAVIKRPQNNHGLIYLQPAYEQLASHFFILVQNQQQLKQLSDLQQLVIGTTTNARYFQQFQEQNNLSKVEVTSLSQKIMLLQKGRIDTFLHYKQSTLPLLASMGLQEEIVLAHYQPELAEKYYFVLTKKSRLFPYLQQVQQVIKQGVKKGAFQRMRQQHYQNKQ